MTTESEPRINLVLAGRKITPWAKALGISGTTQQAIKTNGNVTGEWLTVIQRVENVSVSWLLTGRGRPFLVHESDSDEEAAEHLEQLLSDERWNVGVAWAGHRVCAILTLPAKIATPSGVQFAYTAIEVVTDCGAAAAGVLTAGRESLRFYHFRDEDFEHLVRGRLGTYSILTPNDVPRYVTEITREALLERASQTFRPLTPDERIVLDHYRAMDSSARTAYKSVGSSMAKQAADVDPELVPPAQTARKGVKKRA